MPTLLQRGTNFFDRLTKSAGGRSITLSQTGQTSITITATMEIKDYAILGDETESQATITGFMSPDKFESTDWFITASDLGSFIVRKGVKIEEVIDGVTYTYEVLPIGKRKPMERFDTFREMFVIHSKRVSGNA